MAVDIKQAHRRLIEEVFAKGNFDAFDEVCDTASYRAHDPLTGDADLRQEKENCRMYRTAFPDLRPTLLASYVENDTVVTHWRMTGTHRASLMGVAPTGATCTVEGITIGKFRNGKLVDDYTMWDALGLLRQLGAAPSIQAGATRPSAERQART